MYRIYSFVQNNSKDDIAAIRRTVDPSFLGSVQFAFAGSDRLCLNAEI